MRYVVGLVAAASAALAGVVALPADADPPGTVQLDIQRTETPRVRILGASAAGVLYTVAHPDLGTGSPWDPPDLKQSTWLKPAGKPPVRLDDNFRNLSGTYVFATGNGTVTFRRIDTGATRSCASPLPDRFLPIGWLDADGGTYKLVTIEADGCATRSLATHPGTFLKAADEHGFVISKTSPTSEPLRYATYAEPATLRPIAMGNTHDRSPDEVVLAGDTVAWTVPNTSGTGEPPRPLGWVYRGSVTGTAPTETVVDRQVTSLAVTPTHTAWASDGQTVATRPTSLLGTIPVGGATSTERAGINSVASAGTEFVVDAVTSQAGPHRTPNAATPPVLIQGIEKMRPIAGAVTLGAGRVVYSDSRGTPIATAIRRGYRPGRPPVVGAESVVAPGTGAISQDGRRTAFITATGVWLQTEGAPIRWLSKPVAGRLLDGLKVSGTRVMWTVMNWPPACDPVPICPPPYPEWVYLYDARTGQTTRTKGGMDTVYGLWGNYFLAGKADGSIYRRDLSSTRVERVKGPGRQLNSLDANGSWVAWSTCRIEACSSWSVGYRNMLSAAAPVEFSTFQTRRVRLTGGHLLYETAPKWSDPPVLKSLRLGSTQSTAIGPTHPAAFDAHDETVAWVGRDYIARIAPNSAYVARPRYLGNAIGAASFHPGLWTVEFPISKALPVCGLTIRRGTTVIRALGCATQTGSAIATWDGRDSAGRRVPNGTYTWTFNGRDADGWLLWWNGSARAITGTVTVR